MVLKGEKPITCRPGELLPPVDFDKAWSGRCSRSAPRPHLKRAHLPTACIPRWWRNSASTAKEYGYHHAHGQPCVLQRHGPGRDQQDQHRGRQDPGHQVPGSGRTGRGGHPHRPASSSTACAARCPVPDPAPPQVHVKQVTLADPEDKSQVGASIPGMVSARSTSRSATPVEENQVLAVIEAMKMETSVTARMAGKVRVHSGERRQHGQGRRAAHHCGVIHRTYFTSSLFR